MALFGQNKSPTTKHNAHTVALLCSEIQESRIENRVESTVRMLSILPPKNPLTSAAASFDFEYVLLLFNNYREAVVVVVTKSCFSILQNVE